MSKWKEHPAVWPQHLDIPPVYDGGYFNAMQQFYLTDEPDSYMRVTHTDPALTNWPGTHDLEGWYALRMSPGAFHAIPARWEPRARPQPTPMPWHQAALVVLWLVIVWLWTWDPIRKEGV